MGQSAEELRDNIARTRDDLSGTLDAIEDKVSPNRIIERRKDQIRSRWSTVKSTVMGDEDSGIGAGGVVSGLGDRLSGIGDGVSQAPQTARDSARGNPFAVGVIAFGAGLLAAAIFPGTEAEGRLAQKVQDAAQPLADQAKQAAHEVVSNLQQPAQESAKQLTETVTAGISQVKDSAQQATEDTRQAGADAASTLKDATPHT